MKRITYLVAFTLLVLTHVSVDMYGQEKAATPSPDEKVRMMAELGPGVHKIKSDDMGRLESCIVVGQARISTALGVSKGLLVARRNAKLSAEKEYIKWIKTNVKAIEKSGDETLFVLENAGEGLLETGKSIETNEETIEAEAQGAVRGLQVLGVHQDGETKLLSVVLGWSRDHAVMAGEASLVNESGYSPEEDAAMPETVESGNSSNDEVATKTTTSEELNKYF
jgi:hypothetical protein